MRRRDYGAGNGSTGVIGIPSSILGGDPNNYIGGCCKRNA